MPQKKGNDTGSQANSEPAFLVLGKLRRPHGVEGEIPLELHSQMLELLSPENVVYIGDSYRPLTIEKTRWKQELLLLKFKDVNDRTLVSELTNELVYVRTTQLPPLTEDEYYYHQLIGLDVYEEDDHYLGVLQEIIETGANDVYLIQNDEGEEVLIPATEEMILEIDLDQGIMIVARMEWYGEGD